MTTPAYDVGDLRRLTVTFTDSAGSAGDPAAITFRLRAPDGTVTAYVYGTDAELVRTAAGVYYVDWTCAKPGRHAYRFEGVGTLTTAEGGEFYVRRNEAIA